MKTFIISIIMLSFAQCYSQNDSKDVCIPHLIDNRMAQRINIHDSCIEDSLRVQFKVEVCFEHSLGDTLLPMIVQSVKLKNLTIRSVNSSELIVSFSDISNIDNPFHQYIWDLLSAKVTYWYKKQQYNELPKGERTKGENSIYMGGTFWLVPEK